MGGGRAAIRKKKVRRAEERDGRLWGWRMEKAIGYCHYHFRNHYNMMPQRPKTTGNNPAQMLLAVLRIGRQTVASIENTAGSISADKFLHSFPNFAHLTELRENPYRRWKSFNS
ncbi:hypothetical protein RRG08_029787 [Elysia crispata]|uniref:Uncharacterized protein n=1 Tax=Elysia crispata TaxID=231223 RepID=A0AAE1D173_9GAST|nr:hypothetical protein RRG08_029787 [Elysia crispata]